MDVQATIFFALEMVGIAAFAVSGVMVAIEGELDILGAVVLGAITAVGGGALRDVLLGVLPPTLFVDPRYALVAVGVSIVTFGVAYFLGEKFLARIERLSVFINVLDAIGLGIFVIVGVDAAMKTGHGDNWVPALFVGTITGVGGGIMRDQLAGRVPMVLKKRIYVVAAIIGAVVYYVMVRLDVLRAVALIVSSSLVIAIRLLAAHYKWNLPRIQKAK